MEIKYDPKWRRPCIVLDGKNGIFVKSATSARCHSSYMRRKGYETIIYSISIWPHPKL